MFLNVPSFLLDATALYSCSTRGIKNDPIAARDTKLANEILSKLRHTAQVKTMCKQLNAMDFKL